MRPYKCDGNLTGISVRSFKFDWDGQSYGLHFILIPSSFPFLLPSLVFFGFGGGFCCRFGMWWSLYVILFFLSFFSFSAVTAFVEVAGCCGVMVKDTLVLTYGWVL